jgi:tetratricopeptide (TPR) repeat protein
MARSWMKLLDPRLAALRDRDGASLALARALNARARYPEAAEILDSLIAERRCDAEAWFERVLSLGDRFRPEEAGELLVQLESLIVESPKEAPLQRDLGFLRLKMDDTDGAEVALRRARDLDGTDAKTLELTGLLALHLDQPADAKAWLLKALSLQPRDPRCLRLLALALDRMDDPAGAEAQLTAALECDPDHYWSWHTLGELLMTRGRTQDGLRCIHRARTLNVDDPASYFIVAEVLAELGHLDIAQGHLHALMLLTPEAQVLSEAQALLGEFKRDTGDRDGALAYFTLASETDRESPMPWVALGDLAREEGRWTDTARCYQEALARDPAAADIHVQLGYTLLELQRHREGEQAFLKALEEDPSEYSAYLGLAEVCRQEGRPEDQARMVREAMTLAPEDPDVWNAKGVVLEMQTRLEDATDAYERALRIDVSHRQAANNLGFVLEKRMESGEAGLAPRAQEAWKRRLLICRDEGQSLRMAVDHLERLGVDENTVRRWLSQEVLEDALER